MDLLNKNNIWVGILIATLFPIMVYGVVLTLFEFGTDMGVLDEVADPMGGKRLRTTTLITLCANIILIQLFNKRFTQETLRGILIITFISAVIWFFTFYEDLLANF